MRYYDNTVQKLLLLGPIRKKAEWKPTDIGGCVLWLRSDLGITKNGDNKVSLWADQSGNGNDYGQSNADYRPVWTDDQLNGLPVVKFTQIFPIHNEFLLGSGAVNQPFTTFFVISNLDLSEYAINRQISDSSGSPFVGINSTTDYRIYAGNVLGGGTPVDDADHILCGVFNGASSKVYKNGSLVAEGDAGTDNFGSGDIFLGVDEAYWYYMDGGLAEVLIYSSLSDPNRQLVENYLNGRYLIY